MDREFLQPRLERALLERPEVLDAYLFGSLARGDGHAESNIDVAVFIDTGRVREAPYGYAAELATALSSALGQDRIDIVVLNEAPPLLYHRVLRDGIRLLARDHGPRRASGVALLRLGAADAQDRCSTRGAHRARRLRAMSPSELDAALVRRPLLALDQALHTLRRHRVRSRNGRKVC